MTFAFRQKSTPAFHAPSPLRLVEPAEADSVAPDPDPVTAVAKLRRPRLLIRAARHGLSDYSRKRDLKRVMRMSELPRPGAALRALMAEEAALDHARRAGEATYSVARHIELLIALLAEARLARQPTDNCAADPSLSAT
ncbi:DUF6477 family protein [Thioclava electrotropha]|uniref:DUF6477 family protein n=1 Tax=Thioclava electrotropha TaxID=1549850 RepID=UPI0026A5182B